MDIKLHTKLIFSGMLHVLLVAVNMYQIAHQKWVGCFVVGFLISFVWSFNVQKIAFSTISQRVSYSVGAAIGTITGLFLSTYIYEILL
jgi:hypothetical protein